MEYNPFDEFERMMEEMDRNNRRMNSPSRPVPGYNASGLPSPQRMRMPIANVHETENNIVAAFELPGVEKSDIVLSVYDNYLELKAESKKEKKHDEKNSKSYMMQSQSFYRQVPLPKEVISEKAAAEYNNGILRVEIPKKNKGNHNGKRVNIK